MGEEALAIFRPGHINRLIFKVNTEEREGQITDARFSPPGFTNCGVSILLSGSGVHMAQRPLPQPAGNQGAINSEKQRQFIGGKNAI